MTQPPKTHEAIETYIPRGGGDKSNPVTAVTASGTLKISSGCITLNKATSIALVLRIPKAGGFIWIRHIGGAAVAHTVTLPSGMTFDGTNSIATLNAAEEGLLLFVESATRASVIVNNGAVALSAP